MCVYVQISDCKWNLIKVFGSKYINFGIFKLFSQFIHVPELYVFAIEALYVTFYYWLPKGRARLGMVRLFTKKIFIHVLFSGGKDFPFADQKKQHNVQTTV